MPDTTSNAADPRGVRCSLLTSGTRATGGLRGSWAAFAILIRDEIGVTSKEENYPGERRRESSAGTSAVHLGIEREHLSTDLHLKVLVHPLGGSELLTVWLQSFIESKRHRVCFLAWHFPVSHPAGRTNSPLEREALVASRCLP